MCSVLSVCVFLLRVCWFFKNTLLLFFYSLHVGVRVKRELSSRSCCANGVVILTNPAFEFELAAGDVLFVLAARSEWRAGEGQGGHITAPQFAVSLLGKQKVPPAIKYGKRWLRITKERQHLRNGLEQE
eukprot:m.204239 g.204239  ORF g.204239 m.204239 type:complete len:129 (-) comp13741_c0_seq3:5328-5714(-)